MVKKVRRYLTYKLHNLKLKCVPAILMLVVFTVTVFYMSVQSEEYMVVKVPDDDFDLPGPKVPQGFLVWSPACKIIDLNPLSKNVMKIYTKRTYEPCTERQPLTEIVKDYENNSVTVKFHQHLLPLYLYRGQNYYECCYHEIFRSGHNNTADKKFRLSKCTLFEYDFELPASVEFTLIQCTGMSDEIYKRNKKIIYSNAYAIVRRRKKVEQKVQSDSKVDRKPLSVLMMGIDSISRLNLLRAMPNTAQHLYDTGWFELKGYNKVADNTFPNFMAILTGLSRNLSRTICNPDIVGKLDTCQFIWKDFKENGYVTGYAEDEANIHTFNYMDWGFVEQPTDHYFRPFALAAEKNLDTQMTHNLKICLGYQNYVDHVYQYAIDFAKIYQNQSYFGLFWSNSFSHEDLSDPSLMDLKIKSYLDRLNEEGILNSSIVVFFSDHGMRFGPVRELMTGWLEERLPFIFISLPEWFQNEHPDIVQNLKINRNRLTNPYDLHMTLKHILKISGAETDLPPAVSCPNCQSLFKQIPWNRSCEEAGIDGHWCTCAPFYATDKSTKQVKQAIEYTIDQINFELQAKNTRSQNKPQLCARLIFDETIEARRYDNSKLSFTDFLVKFKTLPSKAAFEATVRYDTRTKNLEILGSVSRINAYAGQSDCIDDASLKKYCYCIDKK